MSEAEAAALKERGNQAFRAKDYEAAADLYSQALRALAAAGQGSPTGAVPAAAAAAQAAAAATLYVNRAAAWLPLRDFLGALEDAERALQLGARSGRAKALYRKAAALQGLGRPAAALAAAQACLQECAAGATQAREAAHLVGQLEAAAAVAEGAGEEAGPPPPPRLPSAGGGGLPPPWDAAPSWECVPSADGVNENLLLMLHGLGDTPAAFARLARHMRLPQTAALALGGPLPVPFTEGGHSWFTAFDGDFELIQGRPGEARRLASLERTLDALQRLLRVLRARWGWEQRAVHLLGFSQGGTGALELALRCAAGGQPLGSCVVISGALLEERLAPPHDGAYKRPAAWLHRDSASDSSSGGCGSSTAAAQAGGSVPSGLPPSAAPRAATTAVLVTHGEADGTLGRGAVERSVQFVRSVPAPLGPVELVSVPGKGHSMVQGKLESEALMRFWSRHLGGRPTAGAEGLPAGATAAGGSSEEGELLELRPGEVTIEQVPS